MTKKVLMLAAKANMIQQFNHRNIKILQGLGYEVHVATNMVDFGSMSTEENERFKRWMDNNQVVAHQVDFERRMGTLVSNIKALSQLNRLFKAYTFQFVHVHSPLGGILGRIIAKLHKVPSVYTAHGFHFFQGGPKSGWLLFFPLEWIFSFITDTLITINNEDYRLAKKYMHARKIIKIHGVGVDVIKASQVSANEKKEARKRIRRSLGISEQDFVILSIGELSDRKNHKIVLEALQQLARNQRSNIYYLIAGTGPNKNLLVNEAKKFGFENNFKLLGYRSDIHDLNYASDLFIFPSLREGLGIAGLDAAVDGTYVIGTNKGGVSEYIANGVNGMLFDPRNDVFLKHLILERINNHQIVEIPEFLQKFDKNNIDQIMREAYEEMKNV